MSTPLKVPVTVILYCSPGTKLPNSTGIEEVFLTKVGTDPRAGIADIT